MRRGQSCWRICIAIAAPALLLGGCQQVVDVLAAALAMFAIGCGAYLVALLVSVTLLTVAHVRPGRGTAVATLAVTTLSLGVLGALAVWLVREDAMWALRYVGGAALAFVLVAALAMRLLVVRTWSGQEGMGVAVAVVPTVLFLLAWIGIWIAFWPAQG